MEWLAVASAVVPSTSATTLALITSQTFTTVRSSGAWWSWRRVVALFWVVVSAMTPPYSAEGEPEPDERRDHAEQQPRREHLHLVDRAEHRDRDDAERPGQDVQSHLRIRARVIDVHRGDHQADGE